MFVSLLFRLYRYNIVLLTYKQERVEIMPIGVPELVVILVILLLLFGAKKLPELAKSVGSSAKELKNAMKDDDDKKETPDKKS
jgi:sec-independent protein translocase protein TatA